MLCNDKKDENFLGLDLDYLATTHLDLLNLNKWDLTMNNKIDTTLDLASVGYPFNQRSSFFNNWEQWHLLEPLVVILTINGSVTLLFT